MVAEDDLAADDADYADSIRVIRGIRGWAVARLHWRLAIGVAGCENQRPTCRYGITERALRGIIERHGHWIPIRIEDIHLPTY